VLGVFLHEPLYCRHLRPIRLPRGAGVSQRLSMKLTMPTGRQRGRRWAREPQAGRARARERRGAALGGYAAVAVP
jgi:hypothetical protein